MPSLLILLACDAGTYGAPDGAAMRIPTEELSIGGGAIFSDEDGLGFLYYDSLMVIGPDGNPMNNIEVQIVTAWLGAYLLPEEAVPEVTEFAEACEDDFTDDCKIFFGKNGESYAELSAVYNYLDDMRPNVMLGATNSRGILPYYIFFDSLPSAGGGFDVQFSIGVDNGRIPVVVIDTSVAG